MPHPIPINLMEQTVFVNLGGLYEGLFIGWQIVWQKNSVPHNLY